MRMFSGSDGYDTIEYPEFAIMQALGSEVAQLQKNPKGVWIIQDIKNKRIADVFCYSVPLDKIVEIYPCSEFMHTYREIKKG